MNTEDLIWKKIDQELDPAEKLKFNQLFQEQGFRSQYEEALELHQELKNTSPDQPSLRFSQNVIEHLPPVNRSNTSENLLPKNWWKWSVGISLGLVFALVLLIIVFTSPNTPGSNPIWLSYFDDVINSIQWGRIPSMLLWTGLAVLLIFAIDELLPRKRKVKLGE